MIRPLIKVVKELETYVVFNDTGTAGYYTVTKETCNGSSLFTQGNVERGESFRVEPDIDGIYTITINGTSSELDHRFESIVISHYPNLISAIIRDINSAFKVPSTSCTKIVSNDCSNNRSEHELLQALVSNINLLLFTFKTINGCNNNQLILINTVIAAFDRFSCDFRTLFCSRELDIKIKGNVDYSNDMLYKYVAIFYYAMYLYELEITSNEQKYINFVNDKYQYDFLRKKLFAAGIDKLEIEHFLAEAFYTGCLEDDPVCSFECFIPINKPVTEEYIFKTKTPLNGIYHVVTLKNTCSTTQVFVNRTVYKDKDFKVFARFQGGGTSVDIGPGEEINLNIIFEGTKNEVSALNIPFTYEGINVSNYLIKFINELEETNNPPVINDVYKTINDTAPYRFTVEDFKNSFFDEDGDTLDKIILRGDTSKFTLNGVPYKSGTIITKDNITNLVFTPDSVMTDTTFILQWQAIDSRGAIS